MVRIDEFGGRFPKDAPRDFRFTWDGDCPGQPEQEYAFAGWINGAPIFDNVTRGDLHLWSLRLEAVAIERLAEQQREGTWTSA